LLNYSIRILEKEPFGWKIRFIISAFDVLCWGWLCSLYIIVSYHILYILWYITKVQVFLPRVTTRWSLDWVFQTFLFFSALYIFYSSPLCTFFILLHFVISGEEGKMLKSKLTTKSNSKMFCLLFENVLVSLWNTCKWKYQGQYRTLNDQLNNQFITRGPTVKSLHSFTSCFSLILF